MVSGPPLGLLCGFPITHNPIKFRGEVLSGPLQLRVQSRSRRSTIAASIAFVFVFSRAPKFMDFILNVQKYFYVTYVMVYMPITYFLPKYFYVTRWRQGKTMRKGDVAGQDSAARRPETLYITTT